MSRLTQRMLRIIQITYGYMLSDRSVIPPSPRLDIAPLRNFCRSHSHGEVAMVRWRRESETAIALTGLQ